MTLTRWFAALSAVALYGCNDVSAPLPATGEFVGRWAGTVWIGSAEALIQKGGSAGDTLYVFANGPSNVRFREESISARVVFTGPGTYQLGPGAARLDETVGGDVLVGTYTTNAQAGGTLTITSYNGVGGLVEGVLTFDAVSSDPAPKFGTRATLEDGRFRATVKAYPGQ